MSTQTGSISFEATGGFNSYAKQNYATLSQIRGQFAISDTGASTTAKTATIVPTNSNWALYNGATVTVKFTNKNTTVAPTLNVNSTGAKPIRDFNGNELTKAAYEWPEGAAMSLTYDGSSWRIQDSNLMERVHTAESAIEQQANSISLMVSQSDMEGYVGSTSSIIYDHYYTENNGTYTFRAKVYKGNRDVTDFYDPDFFTWWLRTEDGDSYLGSGEMMIVNEEQAGLRGSIIGGLEDTISIYLIDNLNNYFITNSGEKIMTDIYWEV